MEALRRGPNESKTCNITGVLLASENAYRSWISLVNQGANPVWIDFGQAAVVNDGQYLAPGGGSAGADKRLYPWTGAIYGISTGGDSRITILEVESVH